MIPYFTLRVFNFTYQISVGFMIELICLLCIAGFTYFSLRKEIKIWNIFFFVTLSAITAIMGSKLFYIIFTQPRLIYTQPSLIWSGGDGNSFYGSMIVVSAIILLITKYFFSSKLFDKAQFMLALIIPFSFTLMKISCFAKGCCYGKISTLKLAVTFWHPHSGTPFLGFPLHPVQLYEALSGLILTLFIFILYKKYNFKATNLLLTTFFILPLSRFITENFRGDHPIYDSLNSLTINQWLSILMITLSTAIFYFINIYKKYRVNYEISAHTFMH